VDAPAVVGVSELMACVVRFDVLAHVSALTVLTLSDHCYCYLAHFLRATIRYVGDYVVVTVDAPAVVAAVVAAVVGVSELMACVALFDVLAHVSALTVLTLSDHCYYYLFLIASVMEHEAVVSVFVDLVVAVVLSLMVSDYWCYHLVEVEATEFVAEALVDH
jgi:hypothetical protein